MAASPTQANSTTLTDAIGSSSRRHGSRLHQRHLDFADEPCELPGARQPASELAAHGCLQHARAEAAVRRRCALDARILRPLWWFGLLEHRDQEVEGSRLEKRHLYRKSPLFDRFLSFDVVLEAAGGVRH